MDIHFKVVHFKVIQFKVIHFKVAYFKVVHFKVIYLKVVNFKMKDHTSKDHSGKVNGSKDHGNKDHVSKEHSGSPSTYNNMLGLLSAALSNVRLTRRNSHRKSKKEMRRSNSEDYSKHLRGKQFSSIDFMDDGDNSGNGGKRRGTIDYKVYDELMVPKTGEYHSRGSSLKRNKSFNDGYSAKRETKQQDKDDATLKGVDRVSGDYSMQGYAANRMRQRSGTWDSSGKLNPIHIRSKSADWVDAEEGGILGLAIPEKNSEPIGKGVHQSESPSGPSGATYDQYQTIPSADDQSLRQNHSRESINESEIAFNDGANSVCSSKPPLPHGKLQSEVSDKHKKNNVPRKPFSLMRHFRAMSLDSDGRENHAARKVSNGDSSRNITYNGFKEVIRKSGTKEPVSSEIVPGKDTRQRSGSCSGRFLRAPFFSRKSKSMECIEKIPEMETGLEKRSRSFSKELISRDDEEFEAELKAPRNRSQSLSVGDYQNKSLSVDSRLNEVARAKMPPFSEASMDTRYDADTIVELTPKHAKSKSMDGDDFGGENPLPPIAHARSRSFDEEIPPARRVRFQSCTSLFPKKPPSLGSWPRSRSLSVEPSLPKIIITPNADSAAPRTSTSSSEVFNVCSEGSEEDEETGEEYEVYEYEYEYEDEDWVSSS